MQRFVVVEKKVGETPLQALEAFRAIKPELKGVPMTYAGRLDPMAEGKLLLLVGDECKHKEKYLALGKEYEFEVLFGISTDSGDVLGIPTVSSAVVEVKRSQLLKTAASLVGNMHFLYPIYSSKVVQGKPLFHHAHAGTLTHIDIPKINSKLYRTSLRGLERISTDDLLKQVIGRIETLKVMIDPSRVGSDFRKEEIISAWKKLTLEKNGYLIARFKTIVGSGTYVRSIADAIAKSCGTTGLALSIKRTKIGRYRSFGKLGGLWTPSY